MIDILFWNWIVTTVELPLSVPALLTGMERRCMLISSTNRNSRGEVQKVLLYNIGVSTCGELDRAILPQEDACIVRYYTRQIVATHHTA